MQGIHGVDCKCLSGPTGRIRDFFRSFPSFVFLKDHFSELSKIQKMLRFNLFNNLLNLINLNLINKIIFLEVTYKQQLCFNPVNLGLP